MGRHLVSIRSTIDPSQEGSRGVRIDDVAEPRVLKMTRDMGLGGTTKPADPLETGADKLANSKLKRILYFIGAFFGLLVLTPLFIAVSALIMLESPGSPLFRQRRSGYGGATFVIYKFRTMRVVEDGPVVVQAKRDDQRVTTIGALLRRTSVDELPQLINVLKGEMSLVGPRPHALAHDDYYGARIPEYDLRFKTKPGLTGLAQVEGRRGPTPDVASMAARVEKDLDYIREWSFVFDIKILLRTVLIFAFHPAAY